MKKIARPLFIVACILLLAYSLLQIGLKLKGYSEGEKTYSQAEESFGITPSAGTSAPVPAPTEAAEAQDEETNPLILAAASCFRDCDFSAIQAVNDEIIAWILIPGTNISYPVCQCGDNQYYLSHMYDKTPGSVGSIFADYRITEPFDVYNTILYGHHMRNQSMFATLMSYQDKGFRDENPYIYICTPDTLYVYEIYAAFQGDPNGISYKARFSSEQDKKEFIDYSLSCSVYKSGITPDAEDSFLTLSTCTGNGHSKRMIVHSVLRASAPVAAL